MNENFKIEDYNEKILCNFAKLKNNILQKEGLNEEKYEKLTQTEKGKEILKIMFEKRPELKMQFVRISTIETCKKIVDEIFQLYLPY